MKILRNIAISLVLMVIFPPWGFLCMLLFLGYLFVKRKRGIKLAIPVYDSRASAPQGIIFKLPNADDYVAFFKQDRKGLAIVASDLNVAGISKYQDNARRFIMGEQQRLVIEREPNNPYDKNALKVKGYWLEQEVMMGVLGYVPKDEAKKIAKAYPNAEIHALVNRIFLPIRGLSAGLRISLAVDKSLVKTPISVSEYEGD